MKIKKIIIAILSLAIMQSLFFSAFAASDKDYTIPDVYWDEGTDYIAGLWDEPESKTSYKVQLYKGNKKIGSTQTTSKEKLVFSKLIAEHGSGTYRFTVYPTRGGKAMLVESETITIESDYLSAIKKNLKTDKNTNQNSEKNTGQNAGPGAAINSPLNTAIINTGREGWNQLPNGNWWWKDSDGKPVKEQWRLYKENWYYFDADGMMKTGWIHYHNLWYYCDANGAMLKDTVTPDNYRVNADGVWEN